MSRSPRPPVAHPISLRRPAVHPTSKKFDTTLEKISCINRAGIRSVVMTTVSGKNIDEVPDIIDAVVQAGAATPWRAAKTEIFTRLTRNVGKRLKCSEQQCYYGNDSASPLDSQIFGKTGRRRCFAADFAGRTVCAQCGRTTGCAVRGMSGSRCQRTARQNQTRQFPSAHGDGDQLCIQRTAKHCG